jgi:protein-L-isoaspartate(D-aspartate) O-methyltransferase
MSAEVDFSVGMRHLMAKIWIYRLLVVAGICLILTGCAESAPTRTPATTTVQAEQPGAQTAAPFPASPDPYVSPRLAMVEKTIVARGVADPDVLRAMRTVPRHRFVPEQYLDQAYADHPLPIGYGQTISQPYIVAWMTELLDLEPGDRVLEIGTGSGYQAAVLAELGTVEVYTIEIIPELAQSAAQRLVDLGYTQVHVRQGDGYYGWYEAAPFDAIIVTAAPDHLPAPLVAQLAEGGCIVIPIGPPGGYQSLWRFVKEEGELVAYNMGGVAFVPFTGGGIQQSRLTPTP